jgi:hypothetical protein
MQKKYGVKAPRRTRQPHESIKAKALDAQIAPEPAQALINEQKVDIPITINNNQKDQSISLLYKALVGLLILNIILMFIILFK